MVKILGWLTLTGLALIALGYIAALMEVAPPLPLILLGLGGAGFLMGGVPWAHTPGNRGLKIAYLGMVGFAGGGAAGLFLGYAWGSTRDLGPAIAGPIFGFWLGAILFGSLGVWWGFSFHRHSGPEGADAGSVTH